MKKFSLMLFCGIILLGVSGCGNKIKGTYYGEKIEGLEYEDNCINFLIMVNVVLRLLIGKA